MEEDETQGRQYASPTAFQLLICAQQLLLRPLLCPVGGAVR